MTTITTNKTPALQEWQQVTLLGLLLLAGFHLLFVDYFFNPQGLGHDYGYFLPSLLDGVYWFNNNGLNPHLFSPAFCGGVPVMANPQSLFYSVPQLLSFVTHPLNAVYLTLLLFALLGYLGFYLLLRISFRLPLYTALIGATLFMFNGFFISRMIYGQLTFHAFMLLPLVSFILLEAEPRKSLLNLLCRPAWAALLLSYMFYAGMVHGLLPVLLAIVVIALIHGLTFNNLKTFAQRFVTTGVITLALCAMKLLPALSFLEKFGRTDYLLSGIENIGQLLQFVLFSLVGIVDLEQAQRGLSNSQWQLADAEFLYEVSIVPLVIIITTVAINIYQRRFITLTRSHWLIISFIALLLLIPLALNYYQPNWNALLKSLPVIENSMTLLRWILVYIPITILIAALAVEKNPQLQRWRAPLLLITVASVIATQPWIDRGFEKSNRYMPNNILQGYQQLNQWQPQISQIVFTKDPYGRNLQPRNRGDMLTMGASQLSCYEPMFGYHLEGFPKQSLHVGNVLDNSNGKLNLKNPACYIYPESNHCAPGDHFTVEQQAQLLSFSRYQQFSYQQPWWQTIANWLSLLTLIGIMIISGVYIKRTVAESHGSADSR